MKKNRKMGGWEGRKGGKVASASQLLNLSTSQLLILLLLLVGCASAPLIEEPSSNIIWPKPPDKARIRFLKSISNSEDIVKTKHGGWLKKTWTFLTGESAEKVLVAPYGVTADTEGNVYVADRDTREIFSFNLQTRKSYSFFFETEDLEDYPIGIVIAEDIYVTYPNSVRAIIFNKNGKVVNEIGKDADLKRPTGVAVNAAKGLLYVADTLGHEIKAFDLSGKPLFTFGKRGDKDGEFNYPTHLFAAKDGTVYVTDELNFRIQAFTYDGKFLFKIGKGGTVPGTFESPKGVAVDSEGNVYVADAMADSVQVFNREGKLLLFFGGSGSGDGQFDGPAGMFIDKDDRIYIADLYNSRVQVFQYLKGE
ncbi:MAG: SMP-30/gluconolactonase/LRE family protein [Deltaproteobacteria bacterium]|nr:SMP-30/gluconolactonase/LRE family protein [Deltaproteobacteria bacterium]